MKILEKGIHHLKNYRDIKKFLLIVPDIISENEEESILEFVKPKLQRKRYEGDHWDSVITKYKETEMSSTKVPDSVNNVIKRLSDIIKESTGESLMQILPPHVLDLAADGYIGPHADSIKFSGGIVAGLSLLSTRMMVLKFDNSGDNIANTAVSTSAHMSRMPYFNLDYSDAYCKQESLYKYKGFMNSNDNADELIEIELPRRSFYILSGPLRYSFTHEILGPKGSLELYSQLPISERRLSVILRDAHPEAIND